MRKLLRDYAMLPIRVFVGSAFVFHGYGKLFAAGGHDGFVGMLQGIGIPLPDLFAWVVGFIEFGGGFALIAGAWVVPVAALQTVIILVALFTVHFDAGFSFMNVIGVTEAGPQFGLPGYEVHLLYLGGLLALIMNGPGALSVERAIAARRESVTSLNLTRRNAA